MSSFKDGDQYRPSPGQPFAGRAGLVTEGAGARAKDMLRVDEPDRGRPTFLPSSIAAAKACIIAKNCDGRCNEICMVTVSRAWLVFLLTGTA
jgi:hypothetical protein